MHFPFACTARLAGRQINSIDLDDLEANDYRGIAIFGIAMCVAVEDSEAI